MTWEHPGDGGDSQQVQAELEEGVKQIFSTNGALAALRADGSVKTCGHPDGGDDSQQVRAGAKEVCNQFSPQVVLSQ